MHLKKFKYPLIISLFFCIQLFAQHASELIPDAMEAYHIGEYAQAHELFNAAYGHGELNEKLTSTVKYYSAECLLKLNNPGAAAAEFEHFIWNYFLSNFRDDALYKLGIIYNQLGQYGKSRDGLSILVKEYPYSEYKGSGYHWIGEAFAVEEIYPDAEEYFKLAISSGRTNLYLDHSIYSLANLYENMEQYENAVRYYDELLAYHRKSNLTPLAQYRIGLCYFKLNEYDSTVLELTDPLINKLPLDLQLEAHSVLANAFFRLKDYDNAVNLYNEILARYSDAKKSDETKYSLGWVQFQMGNYDEAFKIFNSLSLSKVDSIAENASFWKAECKRYSGEVETALTLYENFLENFPNSSLKSPVQFYIGSIFYNENQIPKAERYLIASINSDNVITKGKANTLLGEISLEKKDFESAANYFSSAVKIFNLPDDFKNRAILGLGVTQYYLNDFDNAIMNLTDLKGRMRNFETDKVNFYLGECNFASEDYAEALTNFSNVSPSYKTLAKISLYGKAYSYFNLKDYANSSYFFAEYLNRYKNDENYVDAMLRLADSYYGTKNYHDAEKVYSEIFSNSIYISKNSDEYYRFGQALFKSGKSSKAIAVFNDFQVKMPNSKYADDSQYLIGWIYFQQNDFENAISNYQKIFTRYSSSALKPIAYSSIADSYFNSGDYDSAIEYYQKLIDEYPGTDYVFDAINGIQYCYVIKDKPESAIGLIDDFVSKNPSSKYADKILFKKGDIFYNVGDYKNAYLSFKEFIKFYTSSPLMPNAYYRMGKCALNIDQEEESIINFKIVIESYTNSEVGIASVLELGKIYNIKEDYDAEIKLYEDIIEKMPQLDEIPELLLMKATALVKNKDLPSAYKTFNEIITYHNETLFAAKSKIELGILELERGGFENSEILFKDLSESRQDDLGAKAQYYYGLTQYEQDNIDEAVSAFVRVRSIYSAYDEWYSKSLLKLGDCYVKLGDKKNARDMYRAVVKKHKSDELGKEANNKLKRL